MATRRGRPPKGAAHAHKVDGSDEVKLRLELILRTLSGELTVAEAAEQLGVGEAHFYRLRERALLGAAEALEPRAAGRPRREPESDETDERTAELEAQVRELTGELRAAELREQLALVMPHVLQPPAEEPGEKRRRRNERKRRRRAQRGKR